MPTFQYQALDSRGKKKKGFIEAESQAKAFNLLEEQHLLPLSLAPVSKKSAAWGLKDRLGEFIPWRRVNIGESFYYLGLLLQTGSPLAESLDLIGRMSRGAGGQVWLNIRDAVERGESFSQALRNHPREFPRVYVGMVQVAENVGRLGQVLEKVAQYEEQRSEVSGRLLTAMAYPAVILLVGAGAVFFLLTHVLPNIAKVFSSAHQALPMSTRILLGAGAWMQTLGPLILLLPVLLVLGLVAAYHRSANFRARVDRLLWRIPLFQKYALARFSGLMGFQLDSGIPMVQALECAAEAAGSSYFAGIIRQAQGQVSAGQPLDRVFEKTGAFPEVYILTLSTGQRSGKLGLFLQRMARILEREVDNILKRVVALAEPMLILGMALVVGFIVVAILGPIFDLTTLVR